MVSALSCGGYSYMTVDDNEVWGNDVRVWDEDEEIDDAGVDATGWDEDEDEVELGLRLLISKI